MVRVLSLVGDTLVRIDAEGRPLPALSIAWQTDQSARHWQFTLRQGIKFQDGSQASPAAIAQILGALHPEWNVHAGPSLSDGLTIDTETAAPSLLAELALPRNLVITHNASGVPVGTGAFRVADFQPGKLVKLAASESSWAGRPFVDALDIELGKSLRDQAVALELGRADVVEASPQPANVSSHTRISQTLPVELLALVFPPNSKAQDVRLREAIALSIDRKPIQSVLLRGYGEATASILPNWMTGYAAAFSTNTDIQRAKALIADFHPPVLTLSYDPRDPHAQLVAERIALNVRESGITIVVSLSGAEDIRLVRIALPSPDPALTLREAARQFGLPAPVMHGDTIEDLYHAEKVLLDDETVIPLFHLPMASATNARVHGWTPDRLCGWNLADIWLEESP
jgi:ABC-type transport system substrate-binding protein